MEKCSSWQLSSAAGRCSRINTVPSVGKILKKKKTKKNRTRHLTSRKELQYNLIKVINVGGRFIAAKDMVNLGFVGKVGSFSVGVRYPDREATVEVGRKGGCSLRVRGRWSQEHI